MEGKRKKVLKMQMPLRDRKKAALYFRDMAAEGLILDEVGYLYYSFREGSPQDLWYETQVFEEYPTEQALADYAAQGWQVAGHWESEYVFVTERADAPPLFPKEENELVKLEQEIQEVEERQVRPDLWMLFIILVGFGAAVYHNGFQTETLLTAGKEVRNLLLLFLLALAVHFVQKRRLRKKRERLLEEAEERGDSQAEEIDWRDSYRRRRWGLCLLAAVFCIGFYYLADLNEKTFLLTEAVFAERPILRAEQLAAGDWEPVGEGVDLSQEGLHPPKKIEYGVDSYWTKKKRGKLHNYGVEYRNLPALEEKLYTTQSLRERETGEQAELRMTYTRYWMKGLAKRRFEKRMPKVINGAGIYSGEEIPWANAEREQINLSNGIFDGLRVYLVSAEVGERLEVLAWRGDQVMEVIYQGTAPAAKLLAEIDAVFAAQEENTKK